MVNGDQPVRVSIVDDDLLVRAALRDCMESAEHFVMEFAPAEEFLASGFTQETDWLYIQDQTGSGEASERAMGEGAADFLTKPVRRESLLSSVRQPSGPGANENEETDAG